MDKITIEIRNAEERDMEQFNAVLPFKFGKLLDEQLDYAVFTVEHTATRKFPLNSLVGVFIEENGELFGVCEKWLLVSDESEEVPIGSNTYKHNITIVEPTKLAEGIMLESLCFTNANGNDYTRVAVTPTPTIIKG